MKIATMAAARCPKCYRKKLRLQVDKRKDQQNKNTWVYSTLMRCEACGFVLGYGVRKPKARLAKMAKAAGLDPVT